MRSLEYSSTEPGKSAIHEKRHSTSQRIVMGIGALLLVASCSNSPEAVKSSAASAEKKVFEIDTQEGRVECFGQQRLDVLPGETLSAMVADNTARILSNRSWVQPDLAPIVSGAAEINEMNNPDLLQPDDIVILPLYCNFSP